MNFRERGYIVEICSFAIFKIRTLRIRIAEIAWKYSGSEFETTQLNFQIKRYIYNIYQLFTTIYNIYTINMYASCALVWGGRALRSKNNPPHHELNSLKVLSGTPTHGNISLITWRLLDFCVFLNWFDSQQLNNFSQPFFL